MKFDSNHPECEPDEYFVSNVATLNEYNTIKLKTKRTGWAAYDTSGQIINDQGYFPVFAKKSEVDANIAAGFAGEIKSN